MTRLTSCLFILIFLINTTTPAQENFKIYKLNTSDRLLNKKIHAIHQDKTGFIWFGTFAGLQRYDGTNFINFRHDPFNKQSLSSDLIRCMEEDQDGKLWVGTESGISIINGKQIIRNYTLASTNGKFNPGNGIEDIIETDSGMIVGTWGQGMYIFKDSTIQQLSTTNGLSSNIIVDLLWDQKREVLWIGTWDGGLCMMKNGAISCEESITSGFPSNSARSLEIDHNGALIVGTWGQGVYRLNGDQFSKINLTDNADDPANKVLALKADHERKELWIGTFGGGLYLLDDEGIHQYIHQENNPNSISSNFIESIQIDRDHNIWLGTFNGGACKLERSQLVRTYYHSGIQDSKNSLARGLVKLPGNQTGMPNHDNLIVPISRDATEQISDIYQSDYLHSTSYCHILASNGDVWIGGELSKLKLLRNGKVIDYRPKFEEKFQKQYINKIIESQSGDIWIATSMAGGLHKISDDQITSYSKSDDPASIPSEDIINIYESDDGLLWLCTWHDGLISFDGTNFTQYLHDPNITGSISSNKVFCVHESSEQVLWVGTAQGLNRFDTKQGTFKTYSTQEGLPSNMVAAITSDKNGSLFLATPKGISRFDMKDESISNYYDKAEISTDMTNQFGATPDGSRVLITLDGYLQFHPTQLNAVKPEPQIVVTAIQVDHTTTNKRINETRAEDVQSISVKSNLFKNLSFEFSSLNMDFEYQSEYAYLLEGYHDDWNYIDNKHFINFTNLNPGEYQFKVKSSLDGIYWSKPAVITIEVLPAWWQIWWVRMLFIIVFIAAIYGVIIWRNRFLEIKKRQLVKLVNKKTQAMKEQNRILREQSKLLQQQSQEMEQFAYVASHDLQAPLHTVKGWVELLKDSLNGNLNENSQMFINSISSATQRMSYLIKGLLEHSKIGKDVCFEEVDCNELVQGLLQDLSRNIEETHCKINVDKLPVVHAHRSELTLLFQNLLTNAMKFRNVESTPQIKITCLERHIDDEDYWEFAVADNGIGIKQKYKEQIFGIFERLHNSQQYQGTGIGLAHCKKVVELHGGSIWVESEYGNGSTFYFTIRKNLKPSPNQLEKKQVS